MKLITALLLTMIVSGCSMLPESGTTESLTVNYLMSKSTTRIIDGDSERAREVLDAVEDARGYIEGSESVEIGTLYNAALERVQGLDPADRILVTRILDKARDRLEAAIDSGELDESERVSLLDTLDWIEAAARDELNS